MLEEREQARANRERDGDAKDMLDEIEAQRQTANQLERLVQAKNLEIKSMLLRHANECEGLTNQIEEHKASVEDLATSFAAAERFMLERGVLQQFNVWRASIKG